MGLEEVKREILEEAEETAEEIVAEAEEEKESIIEDAEKEAEKIMEEAEQEIEKKKEAIRKRRISNARMRSRKIKLQRKEEFIERAFEEFRERLQNLGPEERQRFVESCIERADFEIGRTMASEEFREALEQNGFDPEPLEDEGIVLESENGNRRQEMTVEKVVENYRDELRQDVAEVLFK